MAPGLVLLVWEAAPTALFVWHLGKWTCSVTDLKPGDSSTLKRLCCSCKSIHCQFLTSLFLQDISRHLHVVLFAVRKKSRSFLHLTAYIKLETESWGTFAIFLLKPVLRPLSQLLSIPSQCIYTAILLLNWKWGYMCMCISCMYFHVFSDWCLYFLVCLRALLIRDLTLLRKVALEKGLAAWRPEACSYHSLLYPVLVINEQLKSNRHIYRAVNLFFSPV